MHLIGEGRDKISREKYSSGDKKSEEILVGKKLNRKVHAFSWKFLYSQAFTSFIRLHDKYVYDKFASKKIDR